MQSFFRFILRHKVLVTAVCLLITGLSCWSMTRAQISTSLPKLLFGEDPEYREYLQHLDEFGSDQLLVIAFPSPDLDDPQQIARLQRLSDAMQRMPDVDRVESVLSVASLYQRLGRKLGSTNPARALQNDPMASGLLVSKDAEHLAMIAFLTGDDRPLETTPKLANQFIDLFTSEGFAPDDLHFGGLLAVIAEVQRQTEKNFLTLTPFVAIFLLLATYVLFRRLWPVLITFAIGTIAILWTMGFAIAIDPQVSILMAIAPSLILLIAFSDVVHLCSAYLLELRDGQPKDKAIERSAREVGMACLFTSATTFVGFVSLVLIPVPAFRQLGFVLGFGVGIALLLAVTLLPILFSWLPVPRSGLGVAGSSALMEAGLRRMQIWATKRPRLIIAAFGLLTVIAVVGAARVEIESDFNARMDSDNRLIRDTNYLNEHFAGTNTVGLYLTIPEGQPLLSKDFLDRLQRYETALEQLKGVGKALSLADIVQVTAGMNPLAMASFLTGAATRDSLQHLRRMVNPTSRQLQVVLHLNETGVHGTFEIGQKAKTLAREHLGPDVQVAPSGILYVSGNWIETHLRAQARALLLTFLTIALMLVLVFRSWRIGLWSMIPNVIPVLVLGGVLGFCWGEVDSDLVVLALIAIGIAVDDTIHFLARYRTEARRGIAAEMAVRNTYSFAGRAIAMTSLIFAFGQVPFAIAEYETIRLIGILLPLVMLTALLADLLLLPAMITVGWIRVTPAEPSESP